MLYGEHQAPSTLISKTVDLRLRNKLRQSPLPSTLAILLLILSSTSLTNTLPPTPSCTAPKTSTPLPHHLTLTSLTSRLKPVPQPSPSVPRPFLLPPLIPHTIQVTHFVALPPQLLHHRLARLPRPQHFDLDFLLRNLRQLTLERRPRVVTLCRHRRSSQTYLLLAFSHSLLCLLQHRLVLCLHASGFVELAFRISQGILELVFDR